MGGQNGEKTISVDVASVCAATIAKKFQVSCSTADVAKKLTKVLLSENAKSTLFGTL